MTDTFLGQVNISASIKLTITIEHFFRLLFVNANYICIVEHMSKMQWKIRYDCELPIIFSQREGK